ncbi:pentapeptide repeat-containing protein [Streptomyces sp. NPDC032472]|uniref:pentapeptide repeat-containing protein n=1 Tax=Streptomyces sp. NPDC032472 TaxID=3155018 RepID=UPI0033F3D3C6
MPLLLLSLPGLAAIAALLFTWLQVGEAGRQLQIAEDQQITTRFNDAVGNLASKAVDVRVNGIHALERIMKNSAADQPTVVSLLSTYVRQHAPLPRKAAPSADVYTAMDVLARRQPEHDQGTVVNLSHTDLRDWLPGPVVRLQGAVLTGADLRGVDLSYADLENASLEEANLAHATLCSVKCANLHETVLRGANLQGADLNIADLTTVSWCDPLPSEGGCASLREADLRFAKLTDANLRNVDLSYAYLADADLDGADLTGAKLTGTVLEGVKIPGVKGLLWHSPTPLHEASVRDR